MVSKNKSKVVKIGPYNNVITWDFTCDTGVEEEPSYWCDVYHSARGDVVNFHSWVSSKRDHNKFAKELETIIKTYQDILQHVKSMESHFDVEKWKKENL